MKKTNTYNAWEIAKNTFKRWKIFLFYPKKMKFKLKLLNKNYFLKIINN